MKTVGLGPPVAGVRQTLIRRVGISEKHVENHVRSKRRKFAAHFVTLAIIPDTAWFSIGDKPPHDRDFSVSRWTGVRLNAGKHCLDFRERKAFERARAVRRFVRGGFDLHDEKRRASSPALGNECVLRSGSGHSRAPGEVKQRSARRSGRTAVPTKGKRAVAEGAKRP